MSSILEAMQELYLSEHPKETNPDAIRAMDVILETECAFLDTLTEEQKALFVAYSSAVSEFHAILETDMFRSGVRCGVRFLAEVGMEGCRFP